MIVLQETNWFDDNFAKYLVSVKSFICSCFIQAIVKNNTLISLNIWFLLLLEKWIRRLPYIYSTLCYVDSLKDSWFLQLK